MGLKDDPILDAQDYPDDGFVYKEIRDANVICEGKTVKEFKVIMKVKKEGNIYLVDGCGIINIPHEKWFSK